MRVPVKRDFAALGKCEADLEPKYARPIGAGMAIEGVHPMSLLDVAKGLFGVALILVALLVCLFLALWDAPRGRVGGPRRPARTRIAPDRPMRLEI